MAKVLGKARWSWWRRLTIDCPDALDDGKGLAELGEGAAGGDLLALDIREGGNGVLVHGLGQEE